MKYKILVDSSSDLTNDYLVDDEIGFNVIPLSVHILDKEFLDTDDVVVEEMLEEFSKSTVKCTTACPAPGQFAEHFDAEYNFCCTITSKLSGTYNSALLAAKMNDNNTFVIDSLNTVGCLELLVDKLYEFIKSGMEYDEICKKIMEYRDRLTLLFVLDSFDNLVKNGRMSKFTSIVAGILHIKPLCTGCDGEIKMIEKPRTRKAAYKRLVETMIDTKKDFSNEKCIISYCVNKDLAEDVKKLIESSLQFKEIVLRKMKALASFYALENGIIVSFA